MVAGVVAHHGTARPAPPATSPTSRRPPPSAPPSERMFHSAFTRRMRLVTGSCSPVCGLTATKCPMRCWSGGLPVAIVVQMIGLSSGGLLRRRPKAPPRAARRSAAAGPRRSAGRPRRDRRRRGRARSPGRAGSARAAAGEEQREQREAEHVGRRALRRSTARTVGRWIAHRRDRLGEEATRFRPLAATSIAPRAVDRPVAVA